MPRARFEGVADARSARSDEAIAAAGYSTCSPRSISDGVLSAREVDAQTRCEGVIVQSSRALGWKPEPANVLFSNFAPTVASTRRLRSEMASCANALTMMGRTRPGLNV